MNLETQSGNGTTPERAKRGRIETTNTIMAGVFVQRDVWPDIVAWLLEKAMLTPEHGDGWTDYQKLKCNSGGNGNGGEGWRFEELLIFQKKLGYLHLRVLHEISDYPVPSNAAQERETEWRLNGCIGRIRESLNMASKAAVEARKEIDSRKNS